MQKFLEKVNHLLYLHQCEMEGIQSGMPSAKEWENAVNDVLEERKNVLVFLKELIAILKEK